MKVKIVKVDDGQKIAALIRKPGKTTLPSFTDGWRFNFNKHSRNKNYETYVLVCEETPEKIEGCLIFEMKGKVEPYMAYIEVAPHNRGRTKQNDRVAGCLVAFACRLSFTYGEGPYKGYLIFDVFEQNKEDEVKLMAVYSQKYGALKFTETTMVIIPDTGEKLIEQFLN